MIFLRQGQSLWWRAKEENTSVSVVRQGRISPWRAKEDIPPYFVPCRGRRPRRPARFVRHIRFFEELSPPFHRRGRAAVTPMGNTKKQPPDNANRHLFVTGRRGRRPLQTRVAFPSRSPDHRSDFTAVPQGDARADPYK